MPYLKIQTNQSFTDNQISEVISAASQLVADKLGKPERYVMVAVEPPVPMLFAGTDATAAYLELKSIGLPESRTAELSQALCTLLEDKLGISAERIYIEFADAPRKMWGWNRTTF